MRPQTSPVRRLARYVVILRFDTILRHGSNLRANAERFFDSLVAHRNRSPFAKWTFRLIVAIVLIFAGGGLILLVVHVNAETLSSLFRFLDWR
jgi:hypothetical protein